jgi:hypothetical protein
MTFQAKMRAKLLNYESETSYFSIFKVLAGLTRLT